MVFFLSERLNRTTSLNLERTTAVVDDLRNQMWRMIQQTFNSFVKAEDKTSEEEVQQAIETVKNRQTVSPEELQQATETIMRRLEVLEKQKEISAIQVRHEPIPQKLRFQPGDTVRHPRYGEGKVIHSQLLTGREVTTVIFNGNNTRTLLASMLRDDPRTMTMEELFPE